jgi:hypothetical protein
MKVRGNAQLKGTQAYPRDFGASVAHFYYNRIGSIADGVQLTRMSSLPCSADAWDDASLQQVLLDLAASP